MKKKENEEEVIDVLSLSDRELTDLKNKIDMQRSILQTQCAEEMASFLKDDSFDQYSFRGRRKIDKVSKKYSALFDGADYLEKLVNTEIEKREKLEEERKYSGKSIVKKKTQSVEEFLEKEQEKTWAIKSRIE